MSCGWLGQEGVSCVHVLYGVSCTALYAFAVGPGESCVHVLSSIREGFCVVSMCSVVTRTFDEECLTLR